MADTFLTELELRLQAAKERLARANRAAIAADNELQDAGAECRSLEICIKSEKNKEKVEP